MILLFRFRRAAHGSHSQSILERHVLRITNCSTVTGCNCSMQVPCPHIHQLNTAVPAPSHSHRLNESPALISVQVQYHCATPKFYRFPFTFNRPISSCSCPLKISITSATSTINFLMRSSLSLSLSHAQKIHQRV